VVSNIFFMFTPIGEDEPNLTNIFQMGWNHQLVFVFYWNCLFFVEANLLEIQGKANIPKRRTWTSIARSMNWKFDQSEYYWPNAGLAQYPLQLNKHVKILVVTITGFRGTETQRGENWAHMWPRRRCHVSSWIRWAMTRTLLIYLLYKGDSETTVI